MHLSNKDGYGESEGFISMGPCLLSGFVQYVD